MSGRVVALRCAHCRARFGATASHVNRQRRSNGKAVRFFCGRRCFGLARRVPEKVKKHAKAEYDRQRRKILRDQLREEKRVYHQRTYDPAQAKADRLRNRRKRLACQKRYYAVPTHKREKVEYDRKRRADEYGEYGDAYQLLLQLQRLIRRLVPDKYERLKHKGYYSRQRLLSRKRQ